MVSSDPQMLKPHAVILTHIRPVLNLRQLMSFYGRQPLMSRRSTQCPNSMCVRNRKNVYYVEPLVGGAVVKLHIYQVRGHEINVLVAKTALGKEIRLKCYNQFRNSVTSVLVVAFWELSQALTKQQKYTARFYMRGLMKELLHNGNVAACVRIRGHGFNADIWTFGERND
ncbi:hypothetical protein ACTXT7_009311 [Hymenolepis weldensis]